jgi:hypothetical protein
VLGRPTIACGLTVIALAACGGAPAPMPTHADSGIQPRESVSAGADARVLAALLGPEPPVTGLAATATEPEWTDDIVSRSATPVPATASS